MTLDRIWGLAMSIVDRFASPVDLKKRSPEFYIVITSCVLLIVVYALSLSHMSLNTDELDSIYVARQDWHYVLMHRDTNPPLHYVVLKIWMDWFRYSESTARSLSLLATAISAGAVFAMAQGCTPGVKAFPILAAMLFLLSAYIAYYAMEARPYALWIMFVAIATVGLLGYLRQLHQGRRLRTAEMVLPGVLYVAGAIAAVYTHLTAIPFIAAANVTFIYGWLRHDPLRTKSAAAAWSALQLIVLLSILPQLLISRSQVNSKALDWIPPTSLASVLRTCIEAVAGNYASSRLWVVAPLVFLTVALFLIAGRQHFRRDGGLHDLLVLIAAGMLVTIGLSFFRPILVAHTVVWMLAPISIVIASLIARSEHRLQKLALAALVLLMAVNTALFLWKTPQHPWREFLAVMKSSLRPTDVVAAVWKTPITELAYYLPESLGTSRSLAAGSI